MSQVETLGYTKHALFRATERFGWGERELKCIAADIRKGRALVHRKYQDATHYYASHQNQTVLVVWSESRQAIITLFDSSWLPTPYSKRARKRRRNLRR